MKALQKVALALVIIGAINWGLIGFFRFDLVANIFGGQDTFLSRLVYGLVGISGLVSLSLLFSPMEQSESRVTQQGDRKVNYATEFGEETDLSDIDKNNKK